MSKPQAAWVDGICKTCGQYTHTCKCEHPPTPAFMKSFFAAPQEGAGSTAGPATNGEPAAAAPTTIYVWYAEDGSGRIRKWDTKPFENGIAYARPEAARKPDAVDEFRCALSTIAGLAKANGSNALHEISCTALAGIERLKLMTEEATPSPRGK